MTNRTGYAPADASLNNIAGKFARINLDANAEVGLRVTVKRSCSTLDSCTLCDARGTFAERTHCYALGCSCIGVEVSSLEECTPPEREANRAAYTCAAFDQTLVLPSSALVSLSVYDFDGGPSNEVMQHSLQQSPGLLSLLSR